MQELLEYIKAQRAAGLSDEQIIAALKSVGWDEDSINQAMKQPAPIPPVMAEPNLDKYWNKLGRRGQYIVYALLGVVIVSLVGYKAYAYFMSNPDKVWQDSVVKMKNIESAKFKAEISYADKPEPASQDGEESDFGFFGNNTEYKISATAAGAMVIKQNATDVDYDMNSTVTTQFGSLNISLGFESRKIGNNVYYKTEGNPLLGLFGGMGEDDAPKEWVKIDLNDSSNDFSKTLTEIQKTQVADAFTKAKLMKPTKLIGSEEIENVATWHYQAELDKNELKNYIKEVQKITSAEDNSTVESIIDKMEFKKLELWIGKGDHRVRQILIETNAPSFMSASLLSGRGSSRDAKRLADIRQLQTALELFYNDNNRYPVSINGRPSATDGGQSNFSFYMSTWPESPAPADGKCTETENQYNYQQDGPQAYKLTFCLGKTAGGYEEGVLEAGPGGINRKASGSNPNPIEEDPLEGIPFTGTIQIKLNLSDFNSKVQILEPANAYDAGSSMRDARRLADVRQIQTALELFYNDNGRYPLDLNAQPSLNDGTAYKFSDYMFEYPKPPAPPDGSCSETDNRYFYEYLQGSYKLTFCLGNKTSGYGAGIHVASPSGIN